MKGKPNKEKEKGVQGLSDGRCNARGRVGAQNAGQTGLSRGTQGKVGRI